MREMAKSKGKARSVTMEEFWTPRRLAILRRDLIADPVMTMEEKISLDRIIGKVVAARKKREAARAVREAAAARA